MTSMNDLLSPRLHDLSSLLPFEVLKPHLCSRILSGHAIVPLGGVEGWLDCKGQGWIVVDDASGGGGARVLRDVSARVRSVPRF